MAYYELMKEKMIKRVINKASKQGFIINKDNMFDIENIEVTKNAIESLLYYSYEAKNIVVLSELLMEQEIK